MTITIQEKQTEFNELPQKLTIKNVQYYSHHTKLLEYSQRHKALKFLENNCIQYSPEEKIYVCYPIKDYNTRAYRMVWNKELKEFECNCQYFQTKLKKNEPPFICSHILALYYHFKIKNWNKEVENEIIL